MSARGDRAGNEGTGLHGVLVVDKPRGPTSHDVVGRVRRALGEKRVGHAGTLDPMATGVLVVLVGEATKLAPFLTAEDKRYTARVTLGAATDTLDAEGQVVAAGELPAELGAELRALARDAEAAPEGLVKAALREEETRTEQVPPAFSAIHVDGERSHELARAGKEVALAPRVVGVRALRLVAAHTGATDASASAAPSMDLPSLEIDVWVSKGYYVRSFARDLGARLGVPAHLSGLRRTQSGAFRVEDAVPLDAEADALRGALVPIPKAVSLAMPVARLTDAGAVRARQGKRITADDFAPDAAPPRDVAAAWLDGAGRLVAIGEGAGDGFAVVRGFTAP